MRRIFAIIILLILVGACNHEKPKLQYQNFKYATIFYQQFPGKKYYYINAKDLKVTYYDNFVELEFVDDSVYTHYILKKSLLYLISDKTKARQSEQLMNLLKDE